MSPAPAKLNVAGGGGAGVSAGALATRLRPTVARKTAPVSVRTRPRRNVRNMVKLPSMVLKRREGRQCTRDGSPSPGPRPARADKGPVVFTHSGLVHR